MEWEDNTGAIDSNITNQTLSAQRSRRNSKERQPLLNNEDALDWISDTESDDSYDVSNSSGPAQGEYQSLIRQRLAIGGLILCDMFRCIATRTVAICLPFIMLMFDPLFATQGKTKPDVTSKRLIAIPVVSLIIVNLGSVIFGIVSDAWIKKTKMMLFGSYSLLVGYCYISAMDFEIGVNNKINCTLHKHTEVGMPNPSCAIEPLITAYDHPTETVVVVYYIGVALISGAHSLLDTLVPALAGDQVSNRAEVCKLYAWYYFVWKMGDTIAAAVCLGLIKAIDTPSQASIFRPGALDKIRSEMENEFEEIAQNLGIIVLISCILSTFLLSMDVKASLILTSIFKGIGLALNRTAGYETALFSAPRSMQATAMGMFYSIDGLTSVIKMIAIYSRSDSFDPDYSYNYYIIGIVLNFLSIIVLILLQWKMRVGLS